MNHERILDEAVAAGWEIRLGASESVYVAERGSHRVFAGSPEELVEMLRQRLQSAQRLAAKIDAAKRGRDALTTNSKETYGDT